MDNKNYKKNCTTKILFKKISGSGLFGTEPILGFPESKGQIRTTAEHQKGSGH